MNVFSLTIEDICNHDGQSNGKFYMEQIRMCFNKIFIAEKSVFYRSRGGSKARISNLENRPAHHGTACSYYVGYVQSQRLIVIRIVKSHYEY